MELRLTTDLQRLCSQDLEQVSVTIPEAAVKLLKFPMDV